MEITDQDKDAILEAIAYITAVMEESGDPIGMQNSANYKNLAFRIIRHEASFSYGEIENICIALDEYIHNNGPVPAIYSDLLDRLSKSIQRK